MELVRFDDLSADEQEELMAQHEISLHLRDEVIEALQGGDFEYTAQLHNIAVGKELY